MVLFVSALCSFFVLESFTPESCHISVLGHTGSVVVPTAAPVSCAKRAQCSHRGGLEWYHHNDSQNFNSLRPFKLLFGCLQTKGLIKRICNCDPTAAQRQNTSVFFSPLQINKVNLEGKLWTPEISVK